MLSLPELQAQFGATLLAPGDSPGMQVYRGNVFGNWSKALAGAYPIVRKIVGEEFFEGLAREYARAHASTSGDLNEYGAQLAGFVAAFPHTLDLPYLPDVARMEWLAHRAYYAADPVPFDFSTRLPGNPRIRLAPPCALLTSRWPLARIWTVHQDDYQGKIAVDWEDAGGAILVYRPRWKAMVRSLAPAEQRFLEAARDRATLGEALEAACADSAFDPSSALAHWVREGVVTL